MSKWKLYQVARTVDKILNQCDSDMKIVIDDGMDTLAKTGNECTMPLSRHLGDQLFELRIKQKRIKIRFIYFFGENNRIFFVNSFFKTTRTTPDREKNLAKKRRNQIKRGEINYYGVNYTH